MDEFKSASYEQDMTVQQLYDELAKVIAKGLGDVGIALSTGGDLTSGCDQLHFLPAKEGRKESCDLLWILG
jgi:hypothetical protein